MIENKFKKCCHDCPNRKAYLNEDKIYSDDTIVSVLTVIGCEHEEVCGKYMAEQETNDEYNKLESGRELSAILYWGNSAVTAKGLMDYLMDRKTDNAPITLKGSGFLIRITDVELITKENIMFGCDEYQVKLKGELI